MQATAVAYLIWFFAVLQFTIAGWLVATRAPSPARVLHAALLGLNGVATASLGLANVEPFRTGWGVISGYWLQRLMEAADGPTWLWLALLVPVLWRGGGLDAAEWRPRLRIATVTAAFFTLVHGALALSLPVAYGELRIYYWTAVVPLPLTYGVLLSVLVVRMLGAAEAAVRRQYAFLTIAFGSRVVEFAYRYGISWPPWSRTTAWYLRVDGWSYVALAALVLALAALLIVRLRETPSPLRRYDFAVLTMILATIVLTMGMDGPFNGVPGPTLFVFSLLTLVVVRPLFIALAYDRAWTLHAVGALGILTGSFFLAKALAATIQEVPFLLLGRTDLFGLGVAALLVVPLLLFAPGPKRQRVQQPAVPTHAQRVILHLLNEPSAHEAPGMAGAELAEAIGISRKNLAGEVRRAERLLSSGSPASVMIEEHLVGVRGRKHYRLSDAGRRAGRQFTKAWRAGIVMQPDERREGVSA